MSDKPDTYEAKLWKDGKGWTAKLLRNGVYFDMGGPFDDRNAALAWAQQTANSDRRERDNEAAAERVTL